MKRHKLALPLSIALCALLLAALIALLVQGNYPRRLLEKLGLRNPRVNETVALNAWENALEKSDFDVEIAFFGDSMTQRSDFRAFFPGRSICNLGLSRDTIAGMLRRVDAVAAVKPELCSCRAASTAWATPARRRCSSNMPG